MPLEKPIVLYDGSCKFCTTTTDQLRSLDKENVIDWKDLTDESVKRRFPKINWELANEEIHLVHTSGRVVTGSRAVRDIADLIGGDVGHAAAKVMSLPGIRDAADLAYHIVSENRHRIMGRNEPKTPEGED